MPAGEDFLGEQHSFEVDRSPSVAILDDRRFREAGVHPEIVDESPAPEMNRRVDLSSAVVAPGFHGGPRSGSSPAIFYR